MVMTIRTFLTLTACGLLVSCIPDVVDSGGADVPSDLADIDGVGWTVEDGDCWEIVLSQHRGRCTHSQFDICDIPSGAPDVV